MHSNRVWRIHHDGLEQCVPELDHSLPNKFSATYFKLLRAERSNKSNLTLTHSLNIFTQLQLNFYWPSVELLRRQVACWWESCVRLLRRVCIALDLAHLQDAPASQQPESRNEIRYKKGMLLHSLSSHSESFSDSDCQLMEVWCEAQLPPSSTLLGGCGFLHETLATRFWPRDYGDVAISFHSLSSLLLCQTQTSIQWHDLSAALLLNEVSEESREIWNEVSEIFSEICSEICPEIHPEIHPEIFLAGRKVCPQNFTRFFPSEISNLKSNSKSNFTKNFTNTPLQAWQP